jgi:hypothetical protein
MMFIGNDMIEAIPLHPEGLRQPGYLGKFKRYLKQKYEELINQVQQPPEFLIDTGSTQPIPGHSMGD